MKRSKGQRVRTRSILRRRKDERSRLNISRVMHDYQEATESQLFLMAVSKEVCLTEDSRKNCFIQKQTGSMGCIRQRRKHAKP